VRVANVEIADISEELKHEDQFVWVGLFEPDEKLLREIQEEFCLHDLAIEDAHCAHQRPKLEQYENCLFVVLRTAHLAGEPQHVDILNSISSNGSLLERMKSMAEKLGFNSDQAGILEDLIIENKQCYRRAEIHTQVLGNLMGTRASIVGHNLNHLIKKFTIWTVAIMLANLVAGLFSMNVALPLPMQEAYWPFWLINILALLAAGFIFFLRRMNKW
jgi:Mg2+ and Co2+ transporter CorA